MATDDDDDAAPPLTDFNALSEIEQREVAERMLKITSSKWRPFWCKDKTCTTGDPHALLDESRAPVMVEESATAGPNGEPLGFLVDATAEGRHRIFLGRDKIGPQDVYIGQVVLDPKWAHTHARRDQRLPGWLKPWTLVVLSGRGTGKTRTGVEFVTLSARKGMNGAIIGRRGTELVNTHVAEIIAAAHPDFMPVYWSSKDLLEWPNGALTYLFSAEKPENIRSLNLTYAWLDEAAFMDEIETVWMNLTLATRIDDPDNPLHFLITSTPTPTPWVMKMEDDEDVIVRRVSTYANRANLSASFISRLRKEFEGTRKGRQEIHGEVLRDVEGALWNDDLFTHDNVADYDAWLDRIASLDDRVVAIDPAGSSNKRSDFTGIIGGGARRFDSNGERLAIETFDVLGDATIKGTPTEWARASFKLARHIDAHRIIAEKNFGGEMVRQVLDDFADKYPEESRDARGERFKIEVVHASESKETRAEGTVGKYEQGRVTHVTSAWSTTGDLSSLEKEQNTWIPRSRGGRLPSPNRIDALVWMMRALESSAKYEGKVASQMDVLYPSARQRGANASFTSKGYDPLKGAIRNSDHNSHNYTPVPAPPFDDLVPAARPTETPAPVVVSAHAKPRIFPAAAKKKVPRPPGVTRVR